MIVSLALLAAVFSILLVVAYARGGAPLIMSGLGESIRLLSSVAPQLALGFGAAGLLTVLLPSELIAQWLGEESGLQGLLIATVGGALTPGGPYTHFPLVAALSAGGAAPGPLTAYLTAWLLIGFNRALVWELPILGLPFTTARWIVSLAIPVLVGLAFPIVFRAVTRLGEAR